MRYLLSFALLAALIVATVPVHAAEPCDPASVIASANALKSSGDAQKDMAALIDLSKAIQAANSNCAASTTVAIAPKGSGFRKSPVPLGTKLDSAYKGDSIFGIRISEVVRGADAFAKLQEVSSGIEKPDEGKEYLLAFVELEYTKGDEEKPFTMYGSEFASLSNGQFLSKMFFVSLPKPSFELNGFPGAKSKGWIIVEVFTDDTQPVIFYGSTMTGEGIYFATW